MAAPKPHAEFIVACRGCGDHCMVIERVRAVPVEGEVMYSDGYVGGWQGVQTEVLTCPHCKLVMSWRKSCESVDRLRKSGDLGRFKFLPAVWGPASLYQTGFDQYDTTFHPKGMEAGVLPRLMAPPEASQLPTLRKRAALALGLLWLDNDRERAGFQFGTKAPSPKRSIVEDRQRARLLRALVEGARFGGEDSEQNALDLAEWYRELGEWKAATEALQRAFKDAVLRDRARQLMAWIRNRHSRVEPFEALEEDEAPPEPPPAAAPVVAAPPPSPPPTTPPPPSPPPARTELPSLEMDFSPTFAQTFSPTSAATAPAPLGPEPELAPLALESAQPDFAPTEAATQPLPLEPEPEPEPAVPGQADGRSPRQLLDVLLEVLGTLPAETLTRKYLPPPYGERVRQQLEANHWDEETFAVSLIRGFARRHGWPSDVDPAALSDLESFGVDDEPLLNYLAEGFKNASWERWAFDLPAGPAPRRGK